MSNNLKTTAVGPIGQRIVLFVVLFCHISISSFGQVAVQGYAFESENRGYLDQVRVTVMLKDSQVPVEVVHSNAEGFFEVSLQAGEAYTLVAEKSLFHATRQDFVVTPGEPVQYQEVELSRQPGYLLDVILAANPSKVSAKPLQKPVQNHAVLDESRTDQIETELKQAYLQSNKMTTSIGQVPEEYDGFMIEVAISVVKLGAGHPKISRFDKVHLEKTGNSFHYLFGDFAEANDALLFLQEQLIEDYPEAKIIEFALGQRK